MQIKYKEHFYKKWEQGSLGNKPRTWSSYTDLMKSTYEGTVSLRYKGAGGGGFVAYNVPVIKVAEKIAEWKSKGAQQELITFNESAPDERLIAQGELMNGVEGLAFRYSTYKGKMRDAMAQATHVYRLQALQYIKSICMSNSYTDLLELMALYPESVIEFGAYEMPVGECRSRNVLIWEVRNY